jgi:hypothetical protein
MSLAGLFRLSRSTQRNPIPRNGISVQNNGIFVPRDGNPVPRDGNPVPRDGNSIPRDGNPFPRDGNPVPRGTVNFPVNGTVGQQIEVLYLLIINQMLKKVCVNYIMNPVLKHFRSVMTSESFALL